MYITERTYDLNVLARQNLHIHTTHSPCAKSEMLVKNIVHQAVQDGLEVIAFTDHYNSTDLPIIDLNRQLERQVQETGANIRVLYAAELSAYGVGKFLDSIELNRMLDYRLYAYNHFHLQYWEHPEERTPRGYVEHQIQVLESLFATDRADCVAHPFIGRFIRCFEDRMLVTKEITDQELGDIMEKGMKSQVAWEINVPAVLSDPEFSKRYWNIGKEVGVTFNLGTDAHALLPVRTKQYLEQLKSILD